MIYLPERESPEGYIFDHGIFQMKDGNAVMIVRMRPTQDVTYRFYGNIDWLVDTARSAGQVCLPEGMWSSEDTEIDFEKGRAYGYAQAHGLK